MKPVYDDGSVRLYHGDCLDVLPHLDPVDLVFTSPPYNLGTNPGGVFGHWSDGGKRGGNGAWKKADDAIVIDYDAHDDALPHDEYVRWQQNVIAACWRLLAPQGAIFYNHKPRVQRDGLLTPLPLVGDFPVRQIIIWDRGSGFNHTPTAYTPQHEWIIVIAPAAFRLVRAGAAGDVWRFPALPSDHPAPFPVALPARAIETVAPTSVLDPMCGSGTTLVAAKAAGVPAIGIEKSERYCDMTIRRLAQGSLFEEVS